MITHPVSLADSQNTGNLQQNGQVQPTERTANINFLVAANNPDELSKIYVQISRLRQMTSVTKKQANAAPSKLTLGNVYKRSKCHIDSLNVSWDTEYTWELTPGSQVPYILDISMDLTFAQGNLEQQYNLAYVG